MSEEKQKKISVVVAVYNIEKYLRQSISSIISQTYKNLEIILVDDGSTDGSGDICDDFAAQDGRITVIHKENGGLASARLAGAEKITGDYVLNADGDDWLEPDMVEKLYAAIEQNAADLAMCSFKFAYENGETEDYEMLASGVYDRKRLAEEFFPHIVTPTEADIYAPNVWTKMFRVENYLDNLKYYKKEMSMSEDVAITVPNLLKASKIACINEPLYFYRSNIGQMTKKYKQQYFESELLVEDALMSVAAEVGYSLDEQIKRRYVNMAYGMIRVAVEQGLPKKELKQIIRQWSSVDFYKTVNKKQLTMREKLKYFMVKHRSLFLIKLIISMMK